MHFNIPVFIPHMGCPFQCIYCNQKYISGTINAPAIEDIPVIIERNLSTIDYKNAIVEVAFFGGSFTCLNTGQQISYLETVQPYINNKKISSIRISTRPDFINEENLRLLKKYNVKTIELGVQSMSDKVLLKTARGHTAEDVIKASELIRKNGFELGIQTMLGLPEDDEYQSELTAKKVVDIKPVCVRIYPVLVLKDTELEKMFLEGKYVPLSLDKAVDRAAMVLKIYIQNDVNVIKVGLHPSEELESGGKLIAGPFHKSFREMAMSKIWYDQFETFLSGCNKTGMKSVDVTIKVPSPQYNYSVGYQAKNRNLLKQYFNRVRFLRSDILKKLEFEPDYN